MRILITNVSLGEFGGTQNWVRDYVLALAARGHEPAVYTRRVGPPADELRRSGVPVVTRLKDAGRAPDLVHGHHPQAVASLARFAAAPGLFVAHSFDWWMDAPPLLPRVYRYVAVDEPGRDRLVALGAPPGRTSVVPNAVDLERFLPRDPLPRVPRRALLFSNYAREETYLPAVREACSRTGLSLDVAGLGCGNPVARPEEILGRYDLVFAKARCALEALATGCAVILCDAWGMGSLVTAADVARMRPLNFGRKLLTRPVTDAGLVEEIARYDAGDAAEASCRVRAVAGLDGMVNAFLALYDEVLDEHARTPVRPWADRRALVRYVTRIPVTGFLELTSFHPWIRSLASRNEPLSALLSARRRLLRRLGRPGYGSATRGFS